jgi:protein-glutamine gamma-glutamyltransferase
VLSLPRLSGLTHLPRDSRDALLLLAVIGWIVLPLAAHLPTWCVVLTYGVLLWRGALALRAKPLPTRWWLLLVLIVAAAGTYWSHRTLLGRDAGVTLVVVLLALKTMELRGRRDAFVVFFLGFFALLTNFFYSQSLLTAAAMLIAVWGLLTALVNAHMTVGNPSLAQAARTAGFLAVLGAPIMALLFALFPRLAPLWGIPSDGMSGRSGLSSSMSVGNIAQVALDESVAFRVEWLDAQGQPGARSPAQSDLYFRGPVLSSFDGKQWKALESKFPRHMHVPADVQVQGDPVRQIITLEPHNRPWLFALEVPVGPPVGAQSDAVLTPDLQWMARAPITDLTRYQATSYPNFRHGSTAQTARQTVQLQDYLELPPGFNPRTLQWAVALRREAALVSAGSAQLVDRVLRELRTGGYRYTLEPGTYGQHSADEFWFDRKLGFCEHIASAFVIAMRALDVPARIVTGYQGGQVNGVDGVFTVRQSDAHAWAEVWIRGQGWVRVDPTSAVAPERTGSFSRLQAPQTVFGGAMAAVVSPDFAKQMRAIWEAMNNSWNQRILNYTQSKQLDLLKNIGFEAPGWQQLWYLLTGLVMLAGIAGTAWSWWSRHEHDPWLRTLKRTRAALVKHQGLQVSASSTPRELAAAAQAKFGERAQAIVQALLELEALRYSPSAQGLKRRQLAGLSQSLVRISKTPLQQAV